MVEYLQYITNIRCSELMVHIFFGMCVDVMIECDV
jgi:hypothetical protein